MTKTKKTGDQEAKKTDWIANGWTDSLGIKDLWVDLKHGFDTVGYEDDKRRGFDADTNPSNDSEFFIKHPDGRRIRIAREQDKIVLEADERKKYDKKAQAKLRRSFVETKENLLTKEILRQFELLLAAYTPLWNEREDVKARLTQERRTRHARALELGELLAKKSKNGRELAVLLPGNQDEEHEYEAGKIRFLLEDHYAESHRLTKGYIQIAEEGTLIEIEGPIMPSLAAALADLLSNYVAPRVKCSAKKCSHEDYDARGLGLTNSGEREIGKCQIHSPIQIQRKEG